MDLVFVWIIFFHQKFYLFNKIAQFCFVQHTHKKNQQFSFGRKMKMKITNGHVILRPENIATQSLLGSHSFFPAVFLSAIVSNQFKMDMNEHWTGTVKVKDFFLFLLNICC